jgi:hypothetical protein
MLLANELTFLFFGAQMNDFECWPETIRAIAFYSLLAEQTEKSWTAGILVARLPSSRPIDLSLLPDQTDRQCVFHLWKDACRTTSGTKAEMYEVIRETVLPVGIDSIYGDLQLKLHEQYLKCCRVAAYRGHISLRDRTETLDELRSVPHDASDAEYVAVNAFTISGEGPPLYLALRNCQVHHFVALLQRLPVLELDPKSDSTDNPEYWLRHPSDKMRDLLPNLDQICAAARIYLEEYRQRRSKLVRALVCLPILSFVLIDEYGAAPPLKSFV